MSSNRALNRDWLDELRSDLAVAVSLLTRVPLGRWETSATADPTRATRFYPLVGLLVGLVGGGVYWLAHSVALPSLAAGLLAVGATILVTGAFHEDGLGDVADGFGGGGEMSRKLEIMRDSRIGTYGALALILSIGLRAAALAALATPAAAAGALVAAHAFSRAVLPTVMGNTPMARSSGLAAGVGRPTSRHVGLALILGVFLALGAMGPGPGLAVCFSGAAAALAVLWLARVQVGGYTGDVLGAIQQAAETVALLTAAALV